LENLTEGEIIIADKPVMDLPPSERGIAMVFSLMPFIHICQFFKIWLFLKPPKLIKS
jgi:ABC-type thiamine transport system ATPase subunit